MPALIARLLLIAAFCSAVVYVTSAAFVPAMGTGRWDILFGIFAAAGMVLGIGAALANLIRGRGGSQPPREHDPR